MLIIVKNTDENIIDNLLDIYSESMETMESNFDNHNEMIDEYISFIKDFINKPQQLIMVEEVENIWISGLRAIETEKGKWFLKQSKRNLANDIKDMVKCYYNMP